MLNPLAHRDYYRRHLPHYQPPEATLFVTFRLHGSLPAEVIDRLKAEAEENQRRIEQMGDRPARVAALDVEYKPKSGRYGAALAAATHGPQRVQSAPVATLCHAPPSFSEGTR